MKKSVKFLLPVLMTVLLFSLSSVSCKHKNKGTTEDITNVKGSTFEDITNVKGSTFKCEASPLESISFTTNSNFVCRTSGRRYEGTYTVEKAKKKIVCTYEEKSYGGTTTEYHFEFEIINAKVLIDYGGRIWSKI